MKVTKIKQFRVYSLSSSDYETNEMRKFLASIPKDDLIDAKTEQRAFTSFENYVTIIYQEEEDEKENN